MDVVDLLKKADSLSEERRMNNPLFKNRGRFSPTEIDIICNVAEQVQKDAAEVLWFPIPEAEFNSITEGKISFDELDELMKKAGFYGARKNENGFDFGITKGRIMELQAAGLGTEKIDKV